MALVQGEYTGPQTNVQLVAGVEGKIILVLRWRVSTETAGHIRLRSDPGGPAATDLTPKQHMAANTVFDAEFRRAFALATERGKALGFTSGFLLADKIHTLMVWYELVD